MKEVVLFLHHFIIQEPSPFELFAGMTVLLSKLDSFVMGELQSEIINYRIKPQNTHLLMPFKYY